MSDTFDPIAFLSVVSGDGDWPDEFLAWYQPDKWLSEERACAAFVAGKFAVATAPSAEAKEAASNVISEGLPAEPAIKRYTHCEESFDSFEDADGEWVLYEDHCAALAAATPEPADDVHALRAFAQSIIGDWPDVGGLDGFDLQQLGLPVCASLTAPASPVQAPTVEQPAEGSTVRIYPPEFAKMPAGPMCEAMTREQLWQYAMLCGYRTQLSEQDSRPQPATGAADASGYTDARRYRAFIAAGLPVCFLGVEYHTQKDLDAAIDGSINA